MLNDGTKVYFSECSEPAEPTKAFMVVYMENEDCIQSFISENKELLIKVHQ